MNFFKSDQLEHIDDNEPNKMIEKFINIDRQTAIKWSSRKVFVSTRYKKSRTHVGIDGGQK